MTIRQNAAAVLVAALAASCGGGGGGGGGTPTPPAPPPPPPAEFTLSTGTLNFTAEDLIQGPVAQDITGTINTSATGTLYVVIEINGPAVQTVGAFAIQTPTTGSASVYPQNPNVLGVGTHVSTITVRACMNNPTCATGQLTGSPRTVNVTYTVSAYTPRRDTVSPRVAVSGSTGDVIIRGTNLAGATSVSFGGQPAASFTVIGGTEIHARHPALTAGTQAISLNGGTLPFNASLAVTDPQTFSATMLPYPAPAPIPWVTQRPKYDAERRSIYLVLPPDTPSPRNPPGAGRLLRYTWSAGGWSPAQEVSISGLRDVILGPTGARLLGFNDESVFEIDPVSLAVTATYPLPGDNMRTPGLYFHINNLALTNDGYAVVTFGCGCGSAFAPVYFFDTASHRFRRMEPDSYTRWSLDVDGAHGPRAFTSGDGSRVLVGSSFRYQPSDGSLTRQYFSHALRDNNGLPLVEMDRSATRLVLNGTIDPQLYASPKYIDIHDGDYQLLGRIGEAPYGGVHDMHAAVSSDGTRVHVLHFDFQQESVIAMSTFDISAAPSPTGFPLVGNRTTLPPMLRVNWDAGITLTPDGRTLLIAAENGLFVQPVP